MKELIFFGLGALLATAYLTKPKSVVLPKPIQDRLACNLRN